jgi:ring-1,2-phenylacetyl-CoA epoxidase subunit PaaC
MAAAATAAPVSADSRHALVQYLLRLGDDRLVLGSRLSEWCGHAPVLEEDIALANIALDLIGQAALFLGLAAETEGAGRDADALAYLRDAIDYRNALLVEVPNGDFAVTITRQFLFTGAELALDARRDCGEGAQGNTLSRTARRGVDDPPGRWHR